MACNFRTEIEFRLPIKEIRKVREYTETRGVEAICMCDYDPYDYDSDIMSLNYHNTIWINNNLDKIIEECGLSEGTVFKRIFENVYEYPATCFLPKEDILIH